MLIARSNASCKRTVSNIQSKQNTSQKYERDNTGRGEHANANAR